MAQISGASEPALLVFAAGLKGIENDYERHQNYYAVPGSNDAVNVFRTR